MTNYVEQLQLHVRPLRLDGGGILPVAGDNSSGRDGPNIRLREMRQLAAGGKRGHRIHDARWLTNWWIWPGSPAPPTRPLLILSFRWWNSTTANFIHGQD